MVRLDMSHHRSLCKLLVLLFIGALVVATASTWSEPLASYIVGSTAMERLRHLVLVLGCCCAAASCVTLVRGARSADLTRVKVRGLLPLFFSVVLCGIGATRALWFQPFPIEQSVKSLEEELARLEQSMTTRLHSQQDWCNESLAQSMSEIRELRGKVLQSPFECDARARGLLLATRRKNLQRSDVYRVYSDLLLGRLASSRGEITIVTLMSELSPGGPLRGIYTRQLPSLQRATLQAFESNSQGTATLCESRFDLPFEVEVLTDSDVRELRVIGGGSYDWYQRAFPAGSGLYSLSTVGFNQDATQALVRVSHQGPGNMLDSFGSCLSVLAWNGSAWIEVERHLTVVS